MTTAYGSGDNTTTGFGANFAYLLPWIPERAQLRDGQKVRIDFLRTAGDVAVVHRLLNVCIDEGESWPFDKALTKNEFRNYFLGHTAVVIRSEESNDIIGAFYCKPNFPGRCGHFCNGGFITRGDWRRRGVARLMAVTFLRVAKRLQFKASLFNLVFEHNVSSVALWTKLGFSKVGCLPNVVKLEDDKGYKDAYQFYFHVDSLDDQLLGELIAGGGHASVGDIGKAAIAAGSKINKQG